MHSNAANIVRHHYAHSTMLCALNVALLCLMQNMPYIFALIAAQKSFIVMPFHKKHCLPLSPTK